MVRVAPFRKGLAHRLILLLVMAVLIMLAQARAQAPSVVFSNSIVFQPGASFYKQIPGTNFTSVH